MSTEAQDWRYERKALVTDLTYEDVVAGILDHAAFFRRVYAERDVNNAYFDTPDLGSFEQNLAGVGERTKIRLRWYGRILGSIERPVLEFKIKHGHLGRKERFSANPIELQPGFVRSHLMRALRPAELPPPRRLQLASQRLMTLNSYSRAYFLSGCGRYRVTVDRNLRTYRLKHGCNYLLNPTIARDAVIVEIKYASADDDEAANVTSRFPFSLTKMSKYVHGLERQWLSEES